MLYWSEIQVLDSLTVKTKLLKFSIPRFLAPFANLCQSKLITWYIGKLTLLKYPQQKFRREYLQHLLLLYVVPCMNIKQNRSANMKSKELGPTWSLCYVSKHSKDYKTVNMRIRKAQWPRSRWVRKVVECWRHFASPIKFCDLQSAFMWLLRAKWTTPFIWIK